MYRVAQQKTEIFEIPYFFNHYRYNRAVFAKVFRNYSRKQQGTIFMKQVLNFLCKLTGNGLCHSLCYLHKHASANF